MNIGLYKSAAKASGFYDSPIWEFGKEKPDYFDLFSWKLSCIIGGQHLVGSLKEESFDTLNKKIAYLQGVFEDYSGNRLKGGKNEIHFANSEKKVERCRQWINEISRERLFEKTLGQGVAAHTIQYYYPIVHTLVINPLVIEFIQNYQFNES